MAACYSNGGQRVVSLQSKHAALQKILMMGPVGDISMATPKGGTRTTASTFHCTSIVRHAMNHFVSTNSSPDVAGKLTSLQRLLNWWRSPDPNEGYLAAATDHADLERRQRELERTSTGPALVTFNH
jgi:hypothetical protein